MEGRGAAPGIPHQARCSGSCNGSTVGASDSSGVLNTLFPGTGAPISICDSAALSLCFSLFISALSVSTGACWGITINVKRDSGGWGVRRGLSLPAMSPWARLLAGYGSSAAGCHHPELSSVC